MSAAHKSLNYLLKLHTTTEWYYFIDFSDVAILASASIERQSIFTTKEGKHEKFSKNRQQKNRIFGDATTTQHHRERFVEGDTNIFPKKENRKICDYITFEATRFSLRSVAMFCFEDDFQSTGSTLSAITLKFLACDKSKGKILMWCHEFFKAILEKILKSFCF